MLLRAVKEMNMGLYTLNMGMSYRTDVIKVKDYFHKGMELSSKILKESSKMLLDDNISPTITSIGNATKSKESPFSDKLMKYFNYMLTNLMLEANAFAFGFTLRNDLKIKSALTAKDVADYAHECTKIMIKHGWLEKPPQVS